MKPTDIHNSPLDDQVTTDVIATYPEEMVGKALKIMVENKIHHLPVLEGERIVGILSYKDVFDLLVSAGSLRDFQFVPVSRIMRKDILAVTENTEIGEVLHEMRDKHLGALPVLRGGRLAGIVTETDMLRILEKLLDQTHTDEEDVDIVEKGEMMLTNPLVQRVVRQLADMGI